MRTYVVTAVLLAMIAGVDAKSILLPQDEARIIELDRKENEAHTALQKAEQDALMGVINNSALKQFQHEYDSAKTSLETALSHLPNRPEIEQWLLDNHVGIGQ